MFRSYLLYPKNEWLLNQALKSLTSTTSEPPDNNTQHYVSKDSNFYFRKLQYFKTQIRLNILF